MLLPFLGGGAFTGGGGGPSPDVAAALADLADRIAPADGPSLAVVLDRFMHSSERVEYEHPFGGRIIIQRNGPPVPP